VKQHPIWSAELVHGFADADGLVECELWVRHHHEHFDGSGYPDGLVGEDIPWPSRMLLVADAFHVMTTDRPYQRSRTRRDALGELYAGAGTQFCPSAVNLLHARGVWVPSHPELAAPPVLVAGAPPKE
jgi:polar amino acid transport system substrate-binding protein